MVTYLLSKNASVYIKDIWNCNAITYSLENKDTNILKALLKSKPSLDSNDKVQRYSNLLIVSLEWEYFTMLPDSENKLMRKFSFKLAAVLKLEVLTNLFLNNIR